MGDAETWPLSSTQGRGGSITVDGDATSIRLRAHSAPRRCDRAPRRAPWHPRGRVAQAPLATALVFASERGPVVIGCARCRLPAAAYEGPPARSCDATMDYDDFRALLDAVATERPALPTGDDPYRHEDGALASPSYVMPLWPERAGLPLRATLIALGGLIAAIALLVIAIEWLAIGAIPVLLGYGAAIVYLLVRMSSEAAARRGLTPLHDDTPRLCIGDGDQLRFELPGRPQAPLVVHRDALATRVRVRALQDPDDPFFESWGQPPRRRAIVELQAADGATIRVSGEPPADLEAPRDLGLTRQAGALDFAVRRDDMRRLLAFLEGDVCE